MNNMKRINSKHFFHLLTVLFLFWGQSAIASEFPVADSYDIFIKEGSYTVHQVATEITKQTEVAFSYGNKLANTRIHVSIIDLKGISINAILKSVFEPAGIAWVIKDNMVALFIDETEEPTMESRPVNPVSVSGKVIDSNGDPLIGVVIHARNDAGRSAITDLDGSFSLQALPGDELLCSIMGYKEHTIRVKGSISGLRIILEDDIQQLEETVLIAYGVQ